MEILEEILDAVLELELVDVEDAKEEDVKAAITISREM